MSVLSQRCAPARFLLPVALTLAALTSSIATAEPALPAPPVPAAAVGVIAADNNPRPAGCGLHIVLVVDRSSSTELFDADYKAAATAFVRALASTPSEIGIVSFAQDASTAAGYTAVSTPAGVTALGLAIDALPDFVPLTNWEAGLRQVATFAPPDLVVFITDGQPNASGTPGALDAGALDDAITAANALKSNGVTHILGVGVGDSTGFLDNIGEITGEDAGSAPPTRDVVASTTADLFDELNNLALDLCRATVTIHKQIRTGPGGGGLTDGTGWIFGAPSAAPTTATTDGDGVASLGFDHDHLGREVITESAPAGAPATAIESVQCVKDADRGPIAVPVDQVTARAFRLSVAQQDVVHCEVVNVVTGSIEIRKNTTHGAGGVFHFHLFGAFGLDRGFDATTITANVPVTAGTMTDLRPGTYTIEEADLPEGWALTGVNCGDATTIAVEAGDVGIALRAGEHAICTFSDDRSGSDLAITKTAGNPSPIEGSTDQDIRYTVTVLNRGPADAHHDATVVEVAPAGTTLVGATPPIGVVCDVPAGPKLTCTIPSSRLRVVDEPVVIPVEVHVPSATTAAAVTVVNRVVVTSDDDPAPCVVSDDGIRCSSSTNNYAEVSTTLAGVAGETVVRSTTSSAPPADSSPPAAPAGRTLAFTGASGRGLALLGAIFVGMGIVVLALTRLRRRNAR
ncbi:MAG TPA: hypothetical protein VGA11_04350 [Acidimicrobiia bacterium]